MADPTDFKYDRLRLGIITTNVLNLKMLLNSLEILFKQYGWLGQVRQVSSLCLHWLGHLPSLASPACFARCQDIFECYTKGLVPYGVRSYSIGPPQKSVGHLTRYPSWSYEVGHVKRPNFSASTKPFLTNLRDQIVKSIQTF